MAWSVEELETLIPITLHGPFFEDPFFKESWSTVRKAKKEYEEKLMRECNQFSVEKHKVNKVISPFHVPIVEEPIVVQPKHQLESTTEGGGGGGGDQMDEMMEAGTDKYQVLLDVQQFRQDELSVKRSCDQDADTLIVEGKHDKICDPHVAGYVSRHFRRKYNLPSNIATDQVQCHLSSDGILQIILPKLPEQPNGILGAVKSYIIEPIVHALPDFHMTPFWNRFMEPGKSMGVQADHDYFKVLVDVAEFSPEELTIKYTDNYLIIEGKHEDKQIDDHGSVARQFTRIYDLPRCIRLEDLKCAFLSGRILEICAPKLISPEAELEKQQEQLQEQQRVIPISISWEVKQELEKERISQRMEEEQLEQDQQQLDVVDYEMRSKII